MWHCLLNTQQLCVSSPLLSPRWPRTALSELWCRLTDAPAKLKWSEQLGGQTGPSNCTSLAYYLHRLHGWNWCQWVKRSYCYCDLLGEHHFLCWVRSFFWGMDGCNINWKRVKLVISFRAWSLNFSFFFLNLWKTSLAVDVFDHLKSWTLQHAVNCYFQLRSILRGQIVVMKRRNCYYLNSPVSNNRFIKHVSKFFSRVL